MDAAAIMRNAYDLLNAGDLDGFGELLSDDFVEHEQAPGLAPGKTMMQQLGAVPGPPA